TSIINAADGVMVARGDLGVEADYADIPILQHRIIGEAHRQGKPVIVATQVLESMLHSPRPTRAEATDVSHAVREGADAVMLSGETSVGKYPVDAVTVLRRLMESSEEAFASPIPPHLSETPEEKTEDPRAGALGEAAVRLALLLKAQAIVVLSRSGRTAITTAKNHPPLPVLALSNNPRVRRRLSLFHGIAPIAAPHSFGPEEAAAAGRFLRSQNWLKPGSPFVWVTANSLRLEHP
ncbi:MAG TPA: pyruvate kinase, partial [Elusimicrobiota bacterium]|nr:pyruvate kinase [Elusimicrobiota bacterium]